MRSIVPVRDEILSGQDDLSDWVKDVLPDPFFAKVDDQKVVDNFKSISNIVSKNSQYKESAKQKFLDGADPWLIAFAVENCCRIVTHEVSAPFAKAKVKIPDIATQLRVECLTPFEMLRSISAKLLLEEDFEF